MINVFFFLLMVIISSIGASTYFINNQADGDNTGADWKNAFESFSDAGLNGNSSSRERGNTYYVAGSDDSYGSLALENRTLDDSPIKIIKANQKDCGDVEGWKDEYAENTVVFTSDENDNTAHCVIKFYSDNWEIDGITGLWNTGHGIKLMVGDCEFKFAFGIMLDGGVSNVKLSHLEISHCGEDQGDVNHTAFYMNSINSNANDNIYLSYCYFHDVNQTHFLIRNMSNFTLEHSYISRRHTDGTLHGQAMSIDDCGDDDNNIVIRFNLFEDIKGTGMITYGLNHSSTNSDMHIYGNVFRFSDTLRYGLSDGVINSCGDNQANRNMVYNNSFVNITLREGLRQNGGVFWDEGTGNMTFNNIFYNCPGLRLENAGNEYNWYYNCGDNASILKESTRQKGTGSPFVSIEDNDFRLVSSTDPGLLHPDISSLDLLGNTRGEDGNWDRGALEYIDDFQEVSNSVISTKRKDINLFNQNKLNYMFDVLGRIRSVHNNSTTVLYYKNGRILNLRQQKRCFIEENLKSP